MDLEAVNTDLATDAIVEVADRAPTTPADEAVARKTYGYAAC
jgi:hypothetical protein